MRSPRERRRATVANDIELREQASGPTLSGHASVTGVDYEVGFYVERILPGAFKRSLGENPDVVLVLDHGRAGSGLPLARTTAGTLRLVEDDRGLFFQADLDPGDPDAAMLSRKLARGDLDGALSFSFQATDQEWNDEYTERTLKAVSIHRGDVSVVIHGANPSATLTASRSRRRRLLPDYTSSAAVQLHRLQQRELERRARRFT